MSSVVSVCPLGARGCLYRALPPVLYRVSWTSSNVFDVFTMKPVLSETRVVGIRLKCLLVLIRIMNDFYQIKRLLTRTIRMRDETYRWWKIREEWHAPWRPVISVVRVASVLVHRRVGGGRHITVTHLRHRDVFRLKTIREHF